MGMKGNALEPTMSSLLEAAEHLNVLAASALFSALYIELHRAATRELAKARIFLRREIRADGELRNYVDTEP